MDNLNASLTYLLAGIKQKVMSEFEEKINISIKYTPRYLQFKVKKGDHIKLEKRFFHKKLNKVMDVESFIAFKIINSLKRG